MFYEKHTKRKKWKIEEEKSNKHFLVQNFLIASFSDLNTELTLLELPLNKSSK